MSKDLRIFLAVFIAILVFAGIAGAFYFLTTNNTDRTLARAAEQYRLGDVDNIKNGIVIYSGIINDKQSMKDSVVQALYKSAEGYMLLYDKTKDAAKLDTALASYRRLINTYPETEPGRKAYLQIAHINLLEGNYDTAINDLDNIISKFSDPNMTSDAFNEKGEVYFEIGDYDKAVYYFSRKENLNSEYGMLGRAKSYIKAGNTEKGLDIYEDFMKFQGNSRFLPWVQNVFLDTTYNYAYNLYLAKDYIRAVKYFAKIAELFPRNGKTENCLYWIGECYYDRKDYDNAIASFTSVLDNRNSALKDPDALLKLGLCYFEMGNYYKAVKYFDNLIDDFPESRLYKKAVSWKEQAVREIKYQ